jgi:hypothetical protein
MLAVMKRFMTRGEYHLGRLKIKWRIPKVDRSLHVLLSRTTKQNIGWGEDHNGWTISLWLFSLSWRLSDRWAVESLNEYCESIWYGMFMHSDSVMLYLGRKGHRGYDMPWQIRCVEPYEEVTLATASGLSYHDKDNLNMVRCDVRTYYIRVIPLCLRWAGWLAWRVYRAEITFSQEVGPRVGTWKGGTNQVSYLLPYKMQCADALTYYSDTVRK